MTRANQDSQIQTVPQGQALPSEKRFGNLRCRARRPVWSFMPEACQDEEVASASRLGTFSESGPVPYGSRMILGLGTHMEPTSLRHGEI